jgi:uncharacterized protein (TIGR02147 family)
MRTIFNEIDYRIFLKNWIQAQPERWGLMTKLAEAASCQRTYLSKALKGEAQLTPTQAFGIARFCKLSEIETEYLLGLVESERATTTAHRNYIHKKLTALKKNQEDLSLRLGKKEIQSQESDVFYYSTWYWSAIHILTSIPAYQTADAISKRLLLPLPLVESVLEMLNTKKFIQHEKGKWKFLGNESHLSRLSPLIGFHHSNWRQKAVGDAQDMTSAGVHFTVVQSLSRKDYLKIKEMVLHFIENISQIAGPSAEEELMCFNCDFFVP